MQIRIPRIGDLVSRVMGRGRNVKGSMNTGGGGGGEQGKWGQQLGILY